jgi:hypothetical protein
MPAVFVQSNSEIGQPGWGNFQGDRFLQDRQSQERIMRDYKVNGEEQGKKGSSGSCARGSNIGK